MGFCDNITRDQEYAKYGVARGRSFQTKSLYAGGGEFTIPADGSLVEHRYRFENDRQRRKVHPCIHRAGGSTSRIRWSRTMGISCSMERGKEETLELVAPMGGWNGFAGWRIIQRQTALCLSSREHEKSGIEECSHVSR